MLHALSASQFNGRYYSYLSTSVTYNSAYSLASNSTYLGLQGHLVTVSSQDEFAFLKATFGNLSFWIAASDAQREGSWIWTAGPDTGLAVSSMFWAPGQPGNGTAANCAVMNSTGFDDQSCNSFSAAYVVEYECQSTTTSTCPREFACTITCILRLCVSLDVISCCVVLQPSSSTDTTTKSARQKQHLLMHCC